MAKKNSNKKKSQGIWLIERKPEKEDVLPSILRKTWSEIESIDLYHLYWFLWTTQRISEKFSVKPVQVINKLRKV